MFVIFKIFFSLDKTDKVACLMCGKVDTYTNMTLKETVKIGEIELAQKIKKLDEKALLVQFLIKKL